MYAVDFAIVVNHLNKLLALERILRAAIGYQFVARLQRLANLKVGYCLCQFIVRENVSCNEQLAFSLVCRIFLRQVGTGEDGNACVREVTLPLLADGEDAHTDVG